MTPSPPGMEGRGADVIARLALDARPIEDLAYLPDEPMRRHTTLRLGGPADLWCVPDTVDALASLLARADDAGVPVSFVGGGTNLLVRDGGIRGVVLHLRKLNAARFEDPDDTTGPVYVEAGASTGRVLQFALRHGLGGVEFLAGVPGTVGGGLIMNAGTYLGEFTDVVTSVRSLDRAGRLVERGHDECGFTYRDSALPRNEIIVSARLALTPRSREAMDRDVARLRAHRKAREPSGVPNNGSTFKNPEGDYAGRLIEAAGLKGTRRGGAVVSEVHANWLVVDRDTRPACTSRDLIALIDTVSDAVHARFGVRLRREVKIVGED